MKYLRATFFCLLAVSVSAQHVTKQVFSYCNDNSKKILSEYFDLLSIPNHSSDSLNINKNADFIVAMLRKRGVPARLLLTNNYICPPVVYGEVKVPKAKRTIVFYAHYDGQPINPEKWDANIKPFEPALYDAAIEKGGGKLNLVNVADKIKPEWRVYARSSADDKAGVMEIINAYDFIKAAGKEPSCNIKFFFEGEEESGSPHLGQILEQNQGSLKSDVWIIADGPINQSGNKQIDFGVRGDVNIDITTYGANRPLHSGHYGNWAPNPAWQMVKLLSTMKDDDGHVLIKGFYDDVIPFSTEERKYFNEAPKNDDSLKRELGFKQAEGGGKLLFETLNYPSLNINGIRSADVKEKARNVISIEATVTLDLRVVVGTDYLKQARLVSDHIGSQGFHVIDHDPTVSERALFSKIAKVIIKSGYNAQRTPLDSQIARDVIRAVRLTTISPVVIMPTSGASLPLYQIQKYLGANVISVGIVNYDNNQHSENENVKVESLWNGIATLVSIMTMN